MHAYIHSQRLTNGSWPAAIRAINETFTFTGDLGTESSVNLYHGDARQLYGAWIDQEDDALDDAPDGALVLVGGGGGGDGLVPPPHLADVSEDEFDLVDDRAGHIPDERGSEDAFAFVNSVFCHGMMQVKRLGPQSTLMNYV